MIFAQNWDNSARIGRGAVWCNTTILLKNVADNLSEKTKFSEKNKPKEKTGQTRFAPKPNSRSFNAQSLLRSAKREIELSRQELRRERAMLTTLMSNLDGMVYRCRNDAHWTRNSWNEGCQNLTGYHAAELLHNNKIRTKDRSIRKTACACVMKSTRRWPSSAVFFVDTVSSVVTCSQMGVGARRRGYL